MTLTLTAVKTPTDDRINCSCLLDDAELLKSIERIKPYTLLATSNLLELGRQVCAVLAQGIPGDFVECGVYRGGACFLIADILQRLGVQDRRVWLADSFEGVPAPGPLDGATAELALSDWARKHRQNLRASLEEVQDAAGRLGVSRWCGFVKGWFEQTLPNLRDQVGDIAILRIDADWYESVRTCLENLYDRVPDGGIVIIDDYFMEGCALAVHEFLGSRRICDQLETTSDFQPHRIAFLRKSGPTWQHTWASLLEHRSRAEAGRQICSVVRDGDSFVLVDDEQWDRQTLAPNCRALPFLERDGQYWGNPADDSTAIRELERMRRMGAGYIIFVAPAFWWLDYYSGLRQYLESNFKRVLHDAAVIGFKLSCVAPILLP